MLTCIKHDLLLCYLRERRGYTVQSPFTVVVRACRHACSILMSVFCFHLSIPLIFPLPFSSSSTCPPVIVSVGRCYRIAKLTSLTRDLMTPVRRNTTWHSPHLPLLFLLVIILLGVSSALYTSLSLPFLDVYTREKNRNPDRNPTQTLHEHVGSICLKWMTKKDFHNQTYSLHKE